MKIRAAVLVAPGRYEVQAFDRPKLEDGALLMRVELSGICGTDKHTYQGETKQYAGTESETDTPFPIIQGHENVGIIEELTPAIEESGDFYQAKVKVGDRIVMCPDMICGKCFYCTHIQGYSWCSKSQCYGNSFTSAQWPHLLGGWAEYMYFKPGTFFYKVPENIPPKVAVLAELMACAASLDKLKDFSSYSIEGFTTGDTVVVFGVGPLGLLHLAKLGIMGAGKVIAIDKSEYRLDLAKKFGADLTINVDKTTQSERLKIIHSLTGGIGADVVLHMTNRPEPVIEGIEMLRRGGTLLEMGNFADTGEVSISMHRHVLSKNLRLIGLSNHPINAYGPSLKLFDKYAKQYPFADLVTHEFGLAQADEAMQMSMSPQSGKVVINPWL
ncbi:Tdh Threonine dehydrogenase and related Zn-dependent dehydrogenases [Candidatus Nanopelagicaceae bacterium]